MYVFYVRFIEMSCLGRCISSFLIEYFIQIKGTRLLQSSKSRRFSRQYSIQSILHKYSLQTRAAKLFFFFFASVNGGNCLYNAYYSFSALFRCCLSRYLVLKSHLQHRVYHAMPNLTFLNRNEKYELRTYLTQVKVILLLGTESVFYFRRLKTNHKTNSRP